MSEENTPAVLTDDAGDTMLAQAHFEPGETAYLFSVDFTSDELKAALFESTREQPKTLRILLDLPEHIKARVDAEVIVRRVDPVYIYDHDLKEYYTSWPDWYIEGELTTATAFGPASTAVRIYVIVCEGGKLDGEAYIQRIPENSSTSGVIRTEEAFAERRPRRI